MGKAQTDRKYAKQELRRACNLLRWVILHVARVYVLAVPHHPRIAARLKIVIQGAAIQYRILRDQEREL